MQLYRGYGKHRGYGKRQAGATAIEFAILFTVFFVVLYGVIAFSLPLAIQSALQHLASEASRSAIKVDGKGLTAEEYETNLKAFLTDELNQSKSWLPRAWYNGCNGPDDFVTVDSDTATICIRYRGPDGNPNYNDSPIAPVLVLPVVGTVPRTPDVLEGRSSIQVSPSR